MRKCSQSFASPDKSAQNWGSKLFHRNYSAGITVSTPDGNVYKWPPYVDGKFRTGRHNLQTAQKTECWNRLFQHWGLPLAAMQKAEKSHY